MIAVKQLAVNFQREIQMNKITNILLLSTVLVGFIPSQFLHYDFRISISPFVEDEKRVYWVAYFYAQYINTAQLAYCIMFPNGIDKRLRVFIFTLTIIDLVLLFFLASKGFGVQKVGLAIAITLYYDYYIKQNGRG